MASVLPSLPSQNSILQTIQEKARKTRKECQYTEEERTVIGKYKSEYRKLTTRDGRADLFKTKILVDIFNYWDNRQEDLQEEATNTRIKVQIE